MGPETTPSSTTSMQTKGCLRLGACLRVWALANLSISRASPRGSILSVLYRDATHGFLRSKMSRAHFRAVLISSLGETTASTRPKLCASCPLTGLEVYSRTSTQQENATNTKLIKNRWSKRDKMYQHHFKRFSKTNQTG